MSLKKKEEKRKGMLVTFPNQKKSSHNLLIIPKLVSKRPESKSRSVPKEKKKKGNVSNVPKTIKVPLPSHSTYIPK
jgi:hypothetical protein